MTGAIVLSGAPTLDLQASTKKYVDDKVAAIPSTDVTPYLKKDGTVTMTGALNLGSNKIQGLINGVLSTDAVTKGYIDGADSVLQGQIDAKISQASGDTRYLQKAGDQMEGGISMGNTYKISALANGTLTGDAVNLGQVTSQISTAVTGLISQTTADGRYYANTVPLNSITAPTGTLSMNSQKITGLATPTNPLDAVTKQYADSLNTGGSGSSGTTITSADGTKKVVAANTGIQF
jgi:hypothetical protein